MRAIVHAEKPTNANWTTADQLFFQVLDTTINEDQAYDLLIDVNGTVVDYKLDGVLVFSFDMATDYQTILSGNVYTYSKGNSAVTARIQDSAGEMHVLFDDIRTSIVAPTIALNAKDNQGNTAPLPTHQDIFVQEDEVVTLTARDTASVN